MRYAIGEVAARFDHLADARGRVGRLRNLRATEGVADLFALSLIDPRLSTSPLGEPSIARAFPELLSRIGVDAIELAMLHHAYEVVVTRSAGEQNRWLQTQRQFDAAADIARATNAAHLVIRRGRESGWGSAGYVVPSSPALRLLHHGGWA
jgi:hypothetical protein